MEKKKRYDDSMAPQGCNEWVRRAYVNKTAFNEEFQELITRYAWGRTRPHYYERTRCVLMIGTPAAGRIPCARARVHQGMRLQRS